jgi:hypothetical protein
MDASASSVSRDGRWIAYQSYKEFDKFHVYVSPVSEPNVRHRISDPRGGSRPVWSKADPQELFYTRVDDGAMMALRIETVPAFKPGNPVVLFENKGWRAGPQPAQGGVRYWDLAPNGRFLMVKDSSRPPDLTSIHVVLNWHEELKQRTAAN